MEHVEEIPATAIVSVAGSPSKHGAIDDEVSLRMMDSLPHDSRQAKDTGERVEFAPPLDLIRAASTSAAGGTDEGAIFQSPRRMTPRTFALDFSPPSTTTDEAPRRESADSMRAQPALSRHDSVTLTREEYERLLGGGRLQRKSDEELAAPPPPKRVSLPPSDALTEGLETAETVAMETSPVQVAVVRLQDEFPVMRDGEEAVTRTPQRLNVALTATSTSPMVKSLSTEIEERVASIHVSPKKPESGTSLQPRAMSPIRAMPSLRESPVREPYSRESSVREPYSREPYSREPCSRDSPSRESPAREPSARDSPARESPVRELSSRDSPMRESLAREPSARDSPARDSPARDSPARDSPARDSPAHDSLGRSSSQRTDAFVVASPPLVSPSKIAAQVRAQMNDSPERINREAEEKSQRQIEFLQYEIASLQEKYEGSLHTNAEMRAMLSEYERTLAQFIDARRTRSDQHSSVDQLLQERRKLELEIQTLQISFQNLHQRYEDIKGLHEQSRINEATLRQNVSVLQQELAASVRNLDATRKTYEERLERTHLEGVNIKASLENELSATKAKLLKSELKISSLESGIEAKTRENSELMTICDELIKKMDKKS